MQRVTFAISLCLCVVPACQQPAMPMSQLQIREIQTRTYDIKDPKRALKAILNVLQDDGFIPRQADLELGFIHASKEVDVSNGSEVFWAKFWNGRNARWQRNSIVKCAANVTEIKDGMKLRLNFQVKVLNNKGEVLRVEAVHDPHFYQQFFQRVDKGVFYEKEGV